MEPGAGTAGEDNTLHSNLPEHSLLAGPAKESNTGLGTGISDCGMKIGTEVEKS
jgi:hypothetical protein